MALDEIIHTFFTNSLGKKVEICDKSAINKSASAKRLNIQRIVYGGLLYGALKCQPDMLYKVKTNKLFNFCDIFIAMGDKAADFFFFLLILRKCTTFNIIRHKIAGNVFALCTHATCHNKSLLAFCIVEFNNDPIEVTTIDILSPPLSDYTEKKLIKIFLFNWHFDVIVHAFGKFVYEREKF